MSAFVVVAPLAQKDAVMATSLNGGWGEPATDANGLCAWGVADILVLPDTIDALAAIADVQIVGFDGTVQNAVLSAGAISTKVLAPVKGALSSDTVVIATDPWKAATGWTDLTESP